MPGDGVLGWQCPFLFKMLPLRCAVRLAQLHDKLRAMPLTRIGVQSYAGSRADERPRRMVILGREHLVTRIVYESIEESVGARERIHRYKVLTDEGTIIEILHKSDGWYLESESIADCRFRAKA
jgi:hypothetical protein